MLLSVIAVVYIDIVHERGLQVFHYCCMVCVDIVHERGLQVFLLDDVVSIQHYIPAVAR